MGRQKTEVASIFKNELKNGDISWYKLKKVNGKAKYILIGKKNKDDIKTALKAYSYFDKNEEVLSNPPKKEKIKTAGSNKEERTLNEVVEEYYISRNQKADAEFCEKYKNLKYQEVINLVEYKKSMRDRKKIYKYAYKNHISERRLGNLKLKDIRKLDIDNFIREDLGQAKEKKELVKIIDFFKEQNIKEKEIRDCKDKKLQSKVNRYLELDKSIKTLSTKYIFNIMTYTKTAVNYYIDKYTLKIENPFNSFSFKKGINKELRVLSDSEIQTLLKHTKKMDLTVYLCAYLFVYTAARPSTILNVKKCDIDFAKKKLNLYNFKLNRPYKLDLNQESIDYFKKILVDFEDDEYLIKESRNYKDGRKQYQPMTDVPQRFQDVLDELFNQGFDKLKNPEKSVNFYTLRRSIATNLVKVKGYPIFVAQTLLDHNSQKTTEEYLHIDKEDIKNEHNDYLKSIFENISFT